MYCPYLSFIHDKVNCIAIFWTGRLDSLRSCHFRGVWATCLPHKSGGIPVKCLAQGHNKQARRLVLHTTHMCLAPSREAVNTIFKVFWYDSAREMNPRSTDCETDALSTTLSHRYGGHQVCSPLKNDCGHQVLVALTITEINYVVVSLFLNLAWPLLYLYSWYEVLWLRHLSSFRESDKCGHVFPKIIHHIRVRAH